GVTLDVLEQERGRLLAADKVSDRCRLEIGIHFRGDALELAERLDLFQPSIEIARVGAARDRFGLGFLALWLAAGRAHRDAHVHGRLHLVRLRIERSLARFEVKWIRVGVTARRHGAKGRGPRKSPAHRAGRCSLVMRRGDQRPAMTLSSPNRWASDLSSRRWSSLKLMTSG